MEMLIPRRSAVARALRSVLPGERRPGAAGAARPSGSSPSDTELARAAAAGADPGVTNC